LPSLHSALSQVGLVYTSYVHVQTVKAPDAQMWQKVSGRRPVMLAAGALLRWPQAAGS